jgi:hypothetical protein
MQRGLAKGIKLSLPIKLGLAFVAGLLAWTVGPFGLLDKDVVSETPAWILPGIIFGALLLVPHSRWVSCGRAVAALGIGVFAWVAAFAVGGFGWWIVGWLSFVAAGAISGAILGLLVPRLIQSRQYFRYFMALASAGFLGSIPFAMYFRAMDWNDAFFAPQWVIPSYIFWNMLIAIALHLSATRDD